MIHLIIGGARSGKSSYAEKLANDCDNNCGKNVVYIATATAEDEEMKTRIYHHKNSRPSDWALVEEPFYLSKIVESYQTEESVLLIDCLTLWLSNWLCKGDNTPLSNWDDESEKFVEILQKTTNNIFIVSNEVGSGIVPMGELSREFTDKAGWLNQKVASIADKVTLVVAGIPLELKHT